MAAVAAPPTDTLVSQPAREVVYASRREGLVLVHTPEYPILNAATGQRTGQTIGGIRIQFQDGQLRVPLDGTVTTAQGKKLPAPDLLEWLDQHRLFGDTHEGFFKLPTVAPPVSDQEFERINEASMFHNVEQLTAILEAERAGWNRPTITRQIERGLQLIADFQAQIAEQQAAEEVAPTAKPAAKRAAR
jgi:hypothetical protein